MTAKSAKSRICCLDLDTFFVSVERLFRPELVGRPVVVGAMPGNRGVVTAASYEVREFGVRSGMPISEAYRLAPHAVYVPGRHGEYGHLAGKVKRILERYTPIVRTASIDEFFLDFHHCERMYRRSDDVDDDAAIERVIREMRQAIQDELGLPASAGIGPSRSIAKMASGTAKPAGVFMVRPEAVYDFVVDLPIRRWPGIGPVTEQRLVKQGVSTLGQLMRQRGPLADSVRSCIEGRSGSSLGRDRPAFREHDPQGLALGSISNECTFAADVGDRRALYDRLSVLTERVCWRARKRVVVARTITLKLRYAGFETLTRSRTITPTSTDRTVFACVRQLFEGSYDVRRRVRLLGVGLSNLIQRDRQLTLPFEANERADVSAAIDEVRDRFGYDSIHFGVKKMGRWQQ